MADAENNPWLKRKKLRTDKKDPRLLWRTLQIKDRAGGYTAEAIWKNISGLWKLVQTTPGIEAVLQTKLQPEEAKKDMEKRGWKCSWI